MLCFFLCYYAASFRPHIATALFLFAAFLLYDSAQRRPNPPKLWLVGAGALLGYSTMLRYIDWAPLAAWIGVSLLCRKKLTDLILFGIGFGLLASGNLIYDALLSGDPFQLPAALHRSGATNDRLMISWNGFVVTIVRLANVVWIFPPVLLLVPFWRQASSKAKMYAALFLMSVVIYFFYPTSVGGPGPRYFLAYFPFLVLAVTDVCGWLSRGSTPLARNIWNFAVISLVICNLVFAGKEGYTMYWRRDLQRTAAHIAAGKNIFLLKTGTYKTVVGDLTRNPSALSAADNLYFAWCTKPERDALLSRFPGYNVFVYEYPGHLTEYSENLRATLP
jgi:hypothetical protein